jgi:hypothetical protein
MRQLIGVGTPRVLQGRSITAFAAMLTSIRALWGLVTLHRLPARLVSKDQASLDGLRQRATRRQNRGFRHGLLGRCAFVGREGRCRETAFLEFHHVDPYAAGGEATDANIQLRCHAHNEYEARLFFGDGAARESRTAWGASSFRNKFDMSP